MARSRQILLCKIWRRERDLNPRSPFKGDTRLAGEPLRPLGHLSVISHPVKRLQAKFAWQIFWRIRHFEKTKWRDLAKFCIAKFCGGSRMCSLCPASPSGRRTILLMRKRSHPTEHYLCLACHAPPVVHGGGSRIRTHVPFRRSGFQDRRLKPLGHPSVISPPAKYV